MTTTAGTTTPDTTTVATPPAPQPAPAASSATTAQRYHYGLGRRKCAIAQVRLYPGEGEGLVNGRPWKEYFGRDALLRWAQAPLLTADVAERFNVVAKVLGGGRAGQAAAIRLGIARALVAMDQEHKRGLRAQGMLTRDARVKERKKPGLKRARRAPQYTKR